MSRISKSIFRRILVSVLISLVLGGCFTLSDDITPPPGGPQPTLAATQEPRPTSTQSETQPTDDMEAVLDGEGVINIEIFDQSGGVLLESDIDVLLEGYQGFELAYQESQPIGNTGQVVFNDVPMEPGQVFFASISFGGAVYRSDLVEIGEETNSLSLFIQVFDTTTDRSGLIIDRLHVLAEVVQSDLVNVVEIYIISNLGDKTIVARGTGEPSVNFPLPEGAEAIEFDDGVLGGRYLLTEDGFGDTVSIPPGEGVYQVLVYYTLPYTRNKLNFEQEMLFPVGAVIVMVPVGNIKVNSSALEDMGVQNIPGGAVQVFSGSPIQQGQDLEFRISGKAPGANSQVGGDENSSQTLIIALGAFGAVLFLIGIILFIRNRQQLEQEMPVEKNDDDRDHILDSIIALEDLYKNGEITEKEYHKKRAELKKQLSDLVEK